MSQAVFFMTRADLIDVIRIVEAGLNVSYIRIGARTKGGRIPRFSSGHELPDLGTATKDGAHSCDTYLVVPRDAPVQEHFVRDVAFIDQSMNAESITFTPAGV